MGLKSVGEMLDHPPHGITAGPDNDVSLNLTGNSIPAKRSPGYILRIMAPAHPVIQWFDDAGLVPHRQWSNDHDAAATRPCDLPAVLRTAWMADRKSVV